MSDTLHYAPPDDLQGLPADLDIEGVGLPVPFAANELLRDMPANHRKLVDAPIGFGRVQKLDRLRSETAIELLLVKRKRKSEWRPVQIPAGQHPTACYPEPNLRSSQRQARIRSRPRQCVAAGQMP